MRPVTLWDSGWDRPGFSLDWIKENSDYKSKTEDSGADYKEPEKSNAPIDWKKMKKEGKIKKG